MKTDKRECKNCQHNPTGYFCDLMKSSVSHNYYCFAEERRKYTKTTARQAGEREKEAWHTTQPTLTNS